MGNYENRKNLSELKAPQAPQNLADMALRSSVSLQNQQTPTMPHHRLLDESGSTHGAQQSYPRHVGGQQRNNRFKLKQPQVYQL